MKLTSLIVAVTAVLVVALGFTASGDADVSSGSSVSSLPTGSFPSSACEVAAGSVDGALLIEHHDAVDIAATAAQGWALCRNRCLLELDACHADAETRAEKRACTRQHVACRKACRP